MLLAFYIRCGQTSLDAEQDMNRFVLMVKSIDRFHPSQDSGYTPLEDLVMKI
jgi:hypothetical protein